MRKGAISVRLLVAVAGITTACGGSGSSTSEPIVVEEAAAHVQETLREVFDQLGLASLSSAVEEVELAELAGSDGFTFLAPGDEAFAALTGDELANLLSDEELLAEVLRTHVIPERLDAATLSARSQVTTESGLTVDVHVGDDGEVVIGNATVVATDVDMGDGVVHIVDAVLIDPPDTGES